MKSNIHRLSRLLTNICLVACLSASFLSQVAFPAAAQQAPTTAGVPPQPQVPSSFARPLTESDAAAKEEYAYSVAVQAFLFTLPLRVLERERKIRMENTAPNPDEPVAPINQLAHMRKLASAKGRLAYSPNNDTAYSTALLELKDQPMVLHLPDIEDRFFVLTISDSYMENLPNLAGTRGTHGKGGDILFVGPNWNGIIPKGMKVSRMPSNSGVFIVRTRVDGNDDLAALAKIQDKMSLTALSDWDGGKGAGLKLAPAPKLMVRPNYTGDFAYFRTAADLMAENPPAPDQADTLAQFKEIGLEVGKPFDPTTLDEPTRRGVLRAEKVGMKILIWRTHARGIDLPNGWGTLLNGGHFGHDYLDRAELALSGGWINDKEDAIYFISYSDGTGKLLQGGKKYQVHFDKLPPFNKLGFWSLSLYQGEKYQFFDNPLNRYSLGSRTNGLKFNADGSLDIYIQPESPGPAKESNWLPSPQEGNIRMNLRAYYPQEQFLKVDNMSKYLPPIMPVAE
jgi:hypothetical protein